MEKEDEIKLQSAHLAWWEKYTIEPEHPVLQLLIYNTKFKFTKKGNYEYMIFTDESHKFIKSDVNKNILKIVEMSIWKFTEPELINDYYEDLLFRGLHNLYGISFTSFITKKDVNQ